jgi:hypothetical protein
MAEIIPLQTDAFRPRRPAATMDEELARAADIALLQEIAGWAIVRRDIAQVKPLARETRALALEMRSIIRNQPRADNG